MTRVVYRRLAGVLVLLTVQCAAIADQDSQRPEPGFPTADSKKGLQVELVDDAIALGVRHAAINVDLARLVAWEGSTQTVPPVLLEHPQGKLALRADYLHALEHTIRTLSDAGALVYVILLAYEPSDPVVKQVLLHPDYDSTAPNRLAALNVRSADGRTCLYALLAALAERWSRPSGEDGRVAGYIVGNEVNSHWFWNNQGHATLEQVAQDYAASVRIVHDAIHHQADWPRVYISLEHHWNIPYAGGDDSQCIPGKALLDLFAKRVRESPGGDFDWHVAFHPYPENLFEPRFWNDATARDSFDTPRITFKNLQVLTNYLQRPELQYNGRPRRVILSEQGFHSPPGEEGETVQAAAYCYAYEKADRLAGVDAFILHRHVDHPNEGGLLLGLRRRTPGAADPHPKKRIYDCFKAAGTPEWDKASAFALPIVGLESWDEIPRQADSK